MIFLKINCPNFSRLVWRRHTKFHIGMAAANMQQSFLNVVILAVDLQLSEVPCSHVG